MNEWYIANANETKLRITAVQIKVNIKLYFR